MSPTDIFCIILIFFILENYALQISSDFFMYIVRFSFSIKVFPYFMDYQIIFYLESK